MPVNSKAFGMMLRDDALKAGSLFDVTEARWTVSANSSIDLSMQVKVANQTEKRSSEVVAVISFTVDLADKDNNNGNNDDDNNGGNSPIISFTDGDNGTISDKTPVEAPDSKVPALPSVTPNNGYNFDRWEDQDGNPVNPGDDINDNFTLKSVFTKRTPVIDFVDGDNGTVDDKTPIEALDNKVPALPSVTPNDGYVFDHLEDQNGNPVEPGDDIADNMTLNPVPYSVLCCIHDCFC